MTQLVLSTGNVMSTGPSIIRKPGAATRSNLELVNSLRDAFIAAQEDYALQANGAANHISALDIWTERTKNGELYIPKINWSGAGLRDDASQYEITVKLFLLPDTPVQEREAYVTRALDLVRRELKIEKIHLLVVSFPGMSFEGDCEWEADKLNAQQGSLDEEIATWAIFQKLHTSGLVERLGVSEFGSEKLDAFIRRTAVPPAVDQINLKNCCKVPPPLKQLAEKHGVELNVHTDCTDILPNGTLRELLGPSPAGAGVLADTKTGADGLKGEVRPQWVARYMAFVKDRGVIENKGYFAGAELDETL